MTTPATRTETLTVTDRATGAPVGMHEVATLTLDGRDYSSGGAHIDPTCIVAYTKCIRDGYGVPIERVGVMVNITAWGDNDNPIAVGRITAVWPTPRSHVSSTMMQIRVSLTADTMRRFPDLPVTWTGRTAGNGMICRLRPVRR